MSRNPFVVLGAVLAGLLIAAGALFFVVGLDGPDSDFRTIDDAHRFLVEEGTLGSTAEGVSPDEDIVRAWTVFTAVAGVDTEHIAVFEVYHDPDDSSSASVSRDDADDAFWDLTVNTAWNDDANELLHTMIHEYGHMLSLSDGQVSPVAGACATLRVVGGCARADSVIAGFESAFWKRYGAEAPRAEAMGTEDAAVADFFDSHGGFDTFVTEYAATGVVEDLAESWADYVLSDTPGFSYRDATGTAEWSQKVRFFDGFPPFAEQRDRIREAIGVADGPGQAGSSTSSTSGV
ncbi:hypothetical protein [Herbiconiux ginsengi]|uniref:Uncharacterized protein n=1 Tax=Herbiconiux ginsengi TaxID=381665 RepID=A0A1H3LC41_9MICO|nr:hypothetical protein [Herbiconiux ginsengi]SDY61982.1 hypothetical protein SAMN05216554_0918 [Herbiconiux ginsengi]